jgi:hypothetical protein
MPLSLLLSPEFFELVARWHGFRIPDLARLRPLLLELRV